MLTPQYPSADGRALPPELLLEAYRMGVFPMADPLGNLRWFSPDPRGVIPLDGFRVPHGLARKLKTRSFEVHVNRAFPAVIHACAERVETWIDAQIIDAYCELHRRGYAHSVECWREGRLVGGLYGVAVGGAFFGESMFHRETDASKVALHALVGRLNDRGFGLLDTQWVTRHLEQFGAVTIPRSDYLRLLEESVRLPVTFA